MNRNSELATANHSLSISFLKRSLLLFAFILGFGSLSAYAQEGIEGSWKNNKNGAVILIYQEDGKYFGRLIGTENSEQSEKIQAQEEEIIILRNFEQKSATEFCCGEVFQPQKRRTMSANLTLEDKQTLRMDAKLGFVKGTQHWTRM
ncbi:MAG: DUF2147 domain-containing protein [Bacteroidota bacterium]